MTFVDSSTGPLSGSVANFYHPPEGVTPADLKAFLSRPVKIYDYTWTGAQAVGTNATIQPWKLYFQNSVIKNKLENFAYLRANMKLKIVLSASPFHYGSMLISYTPLPGFKSTINGGVNTPVRESQKPHVWIYPQDNAGGEIMLPFLYPKQWLTIKDLTDFTYMGDLYLYVVNQLKNANNTAAPTVGIQIFAWAEDFELSGYTPAAALQSSDEYDGPISGPASAVASMAGKLSDVDGIGKFATAAQIGATSIAKISSLFGFTNTPSIDTVKALKPQAFPHLASPEISYAVEKLTLDPKNELSVDPKIWGCDTQDELNIKYICTREAYLWNENWTTTDAVDAQLVALHVTPHSYWPIVSGSNVLVAQTPLSMVNQLFGYWRGDLIYRFKVVCSKFHRGRLRVSWDPNGNGTGTVFSSDNTAAMQTSIIDINSTTEFEFRVPFRQATPWLRTKQTYSIASWPVDVAGITSYVQGYDNGIITIEVLSPLTGPEDTSTVGIQVFVRGAENIEFAAPRDVDYLLSHFTPQSSDDLEMVSPERSKVESEQYLEYFGEKITTLRSLLARYALTDATPFGMGSPLNNFSNLSYATSRYPRSFGYDVNGLTSVRNQANNATVNFNMSRNIPLTFILPAFVGYRGSIMRSYNFDGGSNPISHIRAFRSQATNIQQIVSNNSYNSSSDFTRWLFQYCNSAGVGGQCLTTQRTNQGLNVLWPNYSRMLFQSTSPSKATKFDETLSPQDEAYVDTGIVEAIVNYNNLASDKIVTMWEYAASGPDFSPVYFLCAPMIYRYGSLPLSE